MKRLPASAILVSEKKSAARIEKLLDKWAPKNEEKGPTRSRQTAKRIGFEPAH